uniref:Uncharacterized protein n=1 Tax=Knipowitschia caucasica TaxID=637954 RepID=A0AAV2MJ90_KNICA
MRLLHSNGAEPQVVTAVKLSSDDETALVNVRLTVRLTDEKFIQLQKGPHLAARGPRLCTEAWRPAPPAELRLWCMCGTIRRSTS